MNVRYQAAAMALGLIGMSAAAPAFASYEGPYLYVQAGEALAHNACQSWVITTWLPSHGANPGCSERSTIYRGGYGYSYSRTWALEINYGTFGNATANGSAALPVTGYSGLSNYSWQLKADGLAIQGVGTFHLGDSLAVIAKAGVARVRFTEYLYSWDPTLPAGVSNRYWEPVVRYDTIAPALGGGIRFDFGPHGSLFLIAETFGSHKVYSSLYGNNTKVTLVAASAGLMYRY
jgi:hypothetical protein